MEKASLLESKFTADEWKIEVGRVLPQLKVTVKPGWQLFIVQYVGNNFSQPFLC